MLYSNLTWSVLVLEMGLMAKQTGDRFALPPAAQSYNKVLRCAVGPFYEHSKGAVLQSIGSCSLHPKTSALNPISPMSSQNFAPQVLKSILRRRCMQALTGQHKFPKDGKY